MTEITSGLMHQNLPAELAGGGEPSHIGPDAMAGVVGNLAMYAAGATAERLGIDSTDSAAELERLFAGDLTDTTSPLTERTCYKWHDLAGNSTHVYEDH
jgi:hypothetical protein